MDVHTTSADNVYLDNVKIIGFRANSDGFDLLSSRYTLVKNVFFRALDDILAIKSNPSFTIPSNPSRGTENVYIEDSSIWVEAAGHAIAFMEQTTPIRNINFKNIDILHVYTDAVWFEGGTNVEGLTMDDVRLENMAGDQVFRLDGNVSNAYINNFQFLGGTMRPSSVSGNVSVTFNNLNYFGNLITSASQDQFSGSGMGGVIFTTNATPTPTPTPPSSGTDCHLWDSSQAVPSGFGAFAS
jgi:polygalacturonase